MKNRVVLQTVLGLALGVLIAGCAGPTLFGGGDGPEAVEVGNKAYNAEMYDTALNAYGIAQESMPNRSEPTYNTANTLFRQQRYREAVDLYDQILTDQDLDVSDWTTFNTGNALYEAGDHEQAIEMYKQALRNNPGDFDAKYNLELALAHLPSPQDEPESQTSEDTQPQEQQNQPGDGPPQEGEGSQPAEGEEGDPQPGEVEEPTDGERDETQQTRVSDQEVSEPDEELEEEGEETGGPGPDSTEWPIIPPTGLTEEQARRLLEMVGESAEPLRNAIQFLRPSDPQTGQDW